MKQEVAHTKTLWLGHALQVQEKNWKGTVTGELQAGEVVADSMLIGFQITQYAIGIRENLVFYSKCNEKLLEISE